jgi:aminotransferase
MTFCEKLLASRRVAVVPGDAFGASGEGFIRICYAQSMQNILEAMNRMEAFLGELRMGEIL